MKLKYSEKMLKLKDTLFIRSKQNFYSSEFMRYIYYDSVSSAYEYVALTGEYEDLSHYEVYLVIENLFEEGVLNLTSTVKASEEIPGFEDSMEALDKMMEVVKHD